MFAISVPRFLLAAVNTHRLVAAVEFDLPHRFPVAVCPDLGDEPLGVMLPHRLLGFGQAGELVPIPALLIFHRVDFHVRLLALVVSLWLN